jgi:uncharacterized damage-inducible protein DinB
MRTITFLVTAIAAFGQNPPTNDIKGNYLNAKTNLIRAAEKMPEEHYGFQPTPEVRTFGQLVGHVADATGMFCASAAGETNPGKGYEKNATTKADLVAAITAMFSYCDGVFEKMNDAKGIEPTKLMGREYTRIGVLAFNNMHNFEHYGNIVTYMRIKGLVPPSTEARMKAGKK